MSDSASQAGSRCRAGLREAGAAWGREGRPPGAVHGGLWALALSTWGSSTVYAADAPVLLRAVSLLPFGHLISCLKVSLCKKKKKKSLTLPLRLTSQRRPGRLQSLEMLAEGRLSATDLKGTFGRTETGHCTQNCACNGPGSQKSWPSNWISLCLKLPSDASPGEVGFPRLSSPWSMCSIDSLYH